MGLSFLGLITLLLLYQLAGELIVIVLDWPLPGPVIGMFLLLISLLLRRHWAQTWIEPTQHFLKYLSLFFVPAGVGVMVHLARMQDEWWAVLLALLFSTLISLVVTAWVMMGLMRFIRPRSQSASPSSQEKNDG